MIKPINKTELDVLADNHKNNKDLLNQTNAVFITKDHLKKFVDALPANCDAVKICFVRFSSDTSDPLKILPAGKNLTQVSLIFVPLKETNPIDWTSTEIADANGNIDNTLCVCEPGDPDPDTGVCPPKKGCSA